MKASSAVILLSLLLTACTPTPVQDPAILAGQAAGLYTATANAHIAQAQSTQAASDALAIQATQYKINLLLAQESEGATQQAAIAQALASDSITATQQALIASAYAEVGVAKAMVSEAQARALGAETVARRESDLSILLILLGVVIIAIVGGLGLVSVRVYKARQDVAHQIYISRAWDAYESEKARYQLTAPQAPQAIRLAERHLADWQRAQHEQSWRGACKRYVPLALEAMQRDGVQAFSESTALKYALVTRADSSEVWLEGYREILRTLQTALILTTPGRGGKVTWGSGWNLDRFTREFDTTPLPYLPTQPPPGLRLSLSELVNL